MSTGIPMPVPYPVLYLRSEAQVEVSPSVFPSCMWDAAGRQGLGLS